MNNKQKYENQTTTIFNQRLAGFLMQNGFILIDIRPNEDKSGRNVFYFKETPELISAIRKFSKQK